jgi:hypothetical protein
MQLAIIFWPELLTAYLVASFASAFLLAQALRRGLIAFEVRS